jgi:hypothetical protein
MPYHISTVCPGATVRYELSPLDLDHVTGCGATGTIVTGLKVDRMKSSDRALADMNAYLRG